MREIIYIIDGGIGHNLNATLALRVSRQSRGSAASVITSWPDIFAGNSDVANVFSFKDVDQIQHFMLDNHRRITMYKDNIYTDRKHLKNPSIHLRHLICQTYELRSPYKDEDKLYFYPTKDELRKAQEFRDSMLEHYSVISAVPKAKIRFAVIQPEGSGIGGNPAAALKAIPVKTTKQIIAESPENIIWLHLKTAGENPINHERVYPLTLPVREFITFLQYVDFGVGCESVANHIIAGLYRKPYICLLGRSNARTYMHEQTVIISEPGSCATFACEMPFYTVERICDRAHCMDAIDPQKVTEAINKIISRL